MVEREIIRILPFDDFAIHTTRMESKKREDEEARDFNAVLKGAELMERSAVYEAKLLAASKVDIIVFADTTVSFYKGVGHDKVIAQNIEKEAGIPAITSATAVVEALRELGVTKVSTATPYVDGIDERLKTFLEGYGFSVCKNLNSNMWDAYEEGVLPPKVAYDLAKKANTPEAEGILISCTNFRTMEILQSLEDELGKPVISSNTATFWSILRSAKYRKPISGYGKLLERGV